jgi:hypothetical protein
VSLLWRDEIGVLFGPRRLVLARVSRGIRPKRTASAFCEVRDGHFATWEPALAALREQLALPEWRDANVRIIVADQWVRYMVVPWLPELTDEAECLAHARELLSSAYGEMADWVVCLGDGLPGRPRVATAMPGALLAGLLSEAQAAGSRVISVQPQLLTAFNSSAPRLPRDSFWFVCVSDGSLAAAHITGGGWQRVHTLRIGSEWSAELRRLRLFGQIAGGNQHEKVFVHAPVWLRPAANEGDDGLEWLNEDSPIDSSTISQVAWLQAHNA